MSPIALALEQLAAEVDRLTRIVGRRVDVTKLGITDRGSLLALDPPGGQISCNRACHLIEAADGWIALNLARDDDRDLLPAWLGVDADDDPWAAIGAAAPARSCSDLLAGADLLGLPAGRVGEMVRETMTAPRLARAAGGKHHASPPRVVDISALWAGPMCGAILAAAGCDVLKVESTRRPDPTRDTMPSFFSRLNGAKRELVLDLTHPDGQARLRDEILAADVLITSVRPRALPSLGLAEPAIFAANPGLTWVAITGYGWTGAAATRVAFGDDAAAAGGLVGWSGDRPHFLGDALADPVTGFAAAIGALEGLASGGGVLADVSLARAAAGAAATCGLVAPA
jgi:hypothetical protein